MNPAGMIRNIIYPGYEITTGDGRPLEYGGHGQSRQKVQHSRQHDAYPKIAKLFRVSVLLGG